MLSLKKITSKKVLNDHILPKECIEYLMFQKIYSLQVYSCRTNQTRLIHTDLNKCIFEMLKLYKTDNIKLNEYNEETKKWNYNPQKNLTKEIFIEELSIGNLMPITNIKTIHCINNGKLIRKINKLELNYSHSKKDNTFIFEYEPLSNFVFN